MPVHAGVAPAHLATALESLLDQERPLDEIVVVADGPLEPAHEAVLSRWPSAPLAVVRLPRNVGIARALNAGLDACSHEWVVRMDSDDVSSPRRVDEQLSEVERTGVDVIGSAMAEFDGSSGNVLGLRRMPVTHEAIAAYMRSRNPINHPTACYRRSLALEAGGYGDLDGVEDYDFFARLLSHGAHFANKAEPLVRYRVDDALFARRAGWRHLRAEWRLQANLRRYGLISPPRAAANLVARTAFRLLPPRLMRHAYARIYRSQPADTAS
ncbi:glycosyltransferase [Nocardioides halotolerans]|uniref:glycosyltransferase n=1 Tax=Nocardioides halotolerans TaxID=433660 RepID=UPI00040335DD|nr:glycosyltransferase [Nocardioides halotolerans]